MPVTVDRMSGCYTQLRLSTLVWSGLLLISQFSSSAYSQAPAPNNNHGALNSTWQHIYVRDRRQALVLDEILVQLQQQQFSEAAANLQFLFNSDRDSWLMHSDGQLISLRQAAEELLAREHARLLGPYRHLAQSEAKLELARARSEGQVTAYLLLIRRYFATPEALTAGEWLIKRWLDDGNWSLAGALALRFARSPIHQDEVSSRLLHMGVVACELSGWLKEAEELRSLSHRKTGTAATNPVPVRNLPAVAPPVLRPMASSSPILEADWSQPLEAAQSYAQLGTVLSEWTSSQREQDLPTAVGWAPLRVGPLIVLRDLDTIRAIDIASGTTQWRYRTSTALGNLLFPADRDGAQRRYRNAMWEAAAANSLVSELSTDGQRVYAVDDAETFTLAGIYGLESQQLPQFSRRDAAVNQLIALNVQTEPQTPRLAWSSRTSPDADRLKGHAFLGPPLAQAGILYVISEVDREICVTALQGQTGRVLWQQPIAESERSVIEDRGRSERACVPIAAKDLILCPTGIGLLVAVDAVTGELRWIHNSLDATAEAFGSAQRFRTIASITQRRHSAFPGTPVVAGDRVVYLPSQSEHLYCLDRDSGALLWQVSHVDAEFLATIRDGLVVLIGRAGVRAYSLEEGHQRWTHPLPGSVAGYGVDVPDGYVVPLDDGYLVNVQLESGRPVGFRFAGQSAQLGHLLATEDRVISVGVQGIAAFPQARTVLQRVAGTARLTGTPLATLKIAEVELAEGNLTVAAEKLASTLPRLAAGPERERAQQLLWETYFQLVRDDPDRADHWLAQLEPLAKNAPPTEQARWLVLASARSVATENWSQLVPQFLQLADTLLATSLMESPEDRDLEISGLVWLHHLLSKIDDPALRTELLQQLAVIGQPELLNSASIAAADLLPEKSAADWRLRQARSFRQQQDLQQAALLLQRNQGVSDLPSRGASELELASLLATADLPVAAGQAIERYRTLLQLSGPELRRTVDLGDSAQAQAAWEAWERAQPIDWAIRKVQIHSWPREDRTVGDLLKAPTGRVPQLDPYEDYQRAISAIPSDSPLEWMTRNTERGTEIGVFDKLSSRKLFEQVLPFGASPPSTLVHLSLGLTVTFSLPGELRALSPLQGSSDYVAWSLKLPEWTRRSGQALCGATTATRAFFQWKNTLLAVDPANGRLLWKRNDLDPSSGMYSDSRIGLLADDEIVFVLGADKSSYRVLDAVTGAIIRKGILPQDARLPRHELGTMILHLTDTGEDRRIRLWDPKTDAILLDDALRSRQLFSRFSEDSVAWITPDARLKIYSLTARQIIVDVPVDDANLATAASLRCFAQQGWHYVSIGRNENAPNTAHFHMPIQDKSIPGDSFRDELIGIAPGGRGVQWRRPIPQRTLLQVASAHSPVLVAGALIRDKRDPNRRWLRIEALDPQTGILLGVGDDLPNDRLLSADYDGTTGHIRLIGRQNIIDLDFSRSVQAPFVLDDPL